MTRKKFIKALMAYGVNRNMAAKAALDAQERKKPYAEYLDEIVQEVLEIVSRTMAEIENRILYGDPDGIAAAAVGIINPINLDIIPQKPETEYKLSIWPDFMPVQQPAVVRINKITDVSLVPYGGYPLGGGGND